MTHPESVAERFYAAFARRDPAGMAACYAPDATFSDPVFPELRGERIGLMWRMLCVRGADLRVEWRLRHAAMNEVVVDWQAWYTFRATGRPVHNRITATMQVEHGRIHRHRDAFDFHRWAAQALGWRGTLLGWAPPVRDAVRREAARALEAFAARAAREGPVRFHAACPILPVRDLPAALDYYTSKLGFTTDWVDAGLMASVSRGPCALMLCQGDQGHPGTWVWIGVGDAEALHAELVARGARIRLPPTSYPWALETQAEDPDGNVLRFGSEPREREPPGRWKDMRGVVWERQGDGNWKRA